MHIYIGCIYHTVHFPPDFTLLARSLEPSNVLHVDPSLASEEEDDSARCRLSGICEGRPTPQECSQSHADNDKSAVGSFIPSYDIASRRDAALACEFSSVDRAERVRDASTHPPNPGDTGTRAARAAQAENAMTVPPPR